MCCVNFDVQRVVRGRQLCCLTEAVFLAVPVKSPYQVEIQGQRRTWFLFTQPDADEVPNTMVA